MLRKYWTAGVVGVLLLVLAGCDDGAKEPSNQSSGTTSAPQVEAPVTPNPENIAQVPPAPASPQVVQSKPVVDANPTSVGIAVWIVDSPVGINLSTGEVMIVPAQHD